MPYKNPEDRRDYGQTHYQKYKDYYGGKAREWTAIYRKRNAAFINRVKRRYGCQRCGYKKCMKALEFHHLDPKQKDVSISSSSILSGSMARVKRELRKCILLCSNCHREEHERLGM